MVGIYSDNIFSHLLYSVRVQSTKSRKKYLLILIGKLHDNCYAIKDMVNCQIIRLRVWKCLQESKGSSLNEGSETDFKT